MSECFNAGKVMYYGIKKVDSKLLNSKKDKETLESLQVKTASLNVKIKKLIKIIKDENISDNEKIETRKEYKIIYNEISKNIEKMNKLKNI